MAREEQVREDLLREATALVERVELLVAGSDEPIVAGFRREGQVSLFFGAEPAFHFNSRNELRRAYAAGRLMKAEQGRLVALERVRTENEVSLVRLELDGAETTAFLDIARGRLWELRAAIAAGQFRINGQVPDAMDVISRVSAWLESLSGELVIAKSPHVT